MILNFKPPKVHTEGTVENQIQLDLSNLLCASFYELILEFQTLLNMNFVLLNIPVRYAFLL